MYCVIELPAGEVQVIPADKLHEVLNYFVISIHDTREQAKQAADWYADETRYQDWIQTRESVRPY